MTSFISFARRWNENSTIDSICTRCYQTIASGDNEDALEGAERDHSCDPNGEYCLTHPDSVLHLSAQGATILT
jgi:hypothetical protein